MIRSAIIPSSQLLLQLIACSLPPSATTVTMFRRLGRTASSSLTSFCNHRTAAATALSGSWGPPRLHFSSTASLRGGAGVFDKIACIGTGKMAEAILQPMIEQGVQPASDVYIFDASPQTMDKAAEKFGVNKSMSIPELVDGADLVLCCVKPQNLTDGFFDELTKGNPSKDTILLSIIAGKAVEVFRRGGFSKIVRSMPNTPAMIGQGMTVWSCTPNLSADERKKIRDVLSSCGKSVRLALVLRL